MPLQSSSSCPALPKGGGTASASAADGDATTPVVTPGGMLGTSGSNVRGRSGSPCSSRGSALAGDLRRIKRQLRDSPGNNSDTSMNLGGAVTPPHHQVGNHISSTALEPVGQGAGRQDPSSLLYVAQVAVKQQVAPLVRDIRSLDTMVGQLQARSEANARGLERLERKVEDLRVSSQTRDHTGPREASGAATAELKGSVNGLMEQMKDLAARVDGLDSRVFAQKSGSEVLKQKGELLEQKVHTLVEQTRLAGSSADEAQRRQVASLRRADQRVEEIARRVAQAEEELRANHTNFGGLNGQLHDLYARLTAVEDSQEQSESLARALQEQVEARDTNHGELVWGRGSTTDFDAAASRAVEQGLETIERRFSTQLEDLATTLANVKYKVDVQVQRSVGLAERLETAHEPAIEALRQELSQARTQDWSRVEGELAQLRSNMQATAEDVAADEANAVAVRERFHQASVDLAVQLQALDDRLSNEVGDLRTHIEALCGSPGSEPPPESSLRNSQQVAPLERERASANEAAEGESVTEALKHQVQHLQGEIEKLFGADDTLWDHVHDLQARLMKISEADRNGSDMGHGLSRLSLEASSIAMEGSPGGGSHACYSRPPLPSTVHAQHQRPQRRNQEMPEDSDNAGSGSCQEAAWDPDAEVAEVNAEAGRHRELQQELDAVSERLQATDRFASRLAHLEQKLRGVGNASGGGSSANSGRSGAGSGAAAAVVQQLQYLAQGVSELQARLLASQLGLQTSKAIPDLGDEGPDGDNENQGATPREDEIVALGERIADVEQDLADLLATRGNETFDEPRTLLLPIAQAGGGETQTGGAAAGGTVPTPGDGCAASALEPGGAHATRPLSPTPQSASNGVVGAEADIQSGESDGVGANGALDVESDGHMQGLQLAEIDEPNQHGLLAGHLGALEDVLRGFAVRLDTLKNAANAREVGADGLAHGAATAATAEVWAHLDDVKDGLVEQRREFDEVRAAMESLSEQVAEMDASMAYVRRKGEQTNTELKALMQRVRGLQERDLAAIVHDARLTQDSINGVSELVDNIDHRLGLVEVTLAPNQELEMTRRPHDDLASRSTSSMATVVAAGGPAAFS